MSNGELLTKTDVKANDIVDGLAKQAVEEHRVSRYEVDKWKKDEEDAWRLLKCIGKVVNLSCNTGVYPFKDNEASRIKANDSTANKHKLKQEKEAREKQRKKEKEEDEVLYRLGRHMPQKVLQISGMRSGWRCKVCRCMSSTKAKLDERKRNGSVAKKWETLAAVAAAKAEKGHWRPHQSPLW